MFNDKEFIKKIILILVIFVCLIIFYYVVSPYQNCIRFVDRERPALGKSDLYGQCMHEKSW